MSAERAVLVIHKVSSVSMKVTVCFGSVRVLVPCGAGDLLVRDLVREATLRYKKATGQVSFFFQFTSSVIDEVLKTLNASIISRVFAAISLADEQILLVLSNKYVYFFLFISSGITIL